MIKSEFITINNTQYRKTYSDSGNQLKQYLDDVFTGSIYNEAIDVLTANYTYKEIEE